MLKAIVRFSLRFREITIGLACALLAYGVYSFSRARFDVFPEFAPPQVSIQTEAPGLAPQQVEVLVTTPLENAINGLPAIQSMRSRSIQGLSVITVVFNETTDIYRDRQVIAERLSTVAGQLPAGVRAPLMAPLTSSTGTVMAVGLTSKKLSLMQLRTIADWTIRPRLLAVSGVAGVTVFGGEVRQLQIQFDPQRLVRFGLSVGDVLAAGRQATGIRGAGFVETANQRVVLQTEGQSIEASQLARTVVAHQNGANVTLGDVARVVAAPAPAIGASTIRGKPGIMLVVESQYGASTLDVTQGVDKALSELGPSLKKEGVAVHPNVFRATDFIYTSLKNIRNSLLIGAVLVVVVLFLFLFNFRTAAISCTAIPVSLLAAVVILERMGLSLNTMTLGGLSIAIGEVVDDAVIDVENIYRRLRENRASQSPRSAFRVALDASLEVRSPVVYATFAIVLVFLPILTMSGVAGHIFAPLGIAFIWATLASLLVAMTLTPALCLLLLGNRELPPHEPPIVRWGKKGYRKILLGVEKAPRATMAAVLIMILVGASGLYFLSVAFLPHLREGNLTVHMDAVPGTSLQESVRLGDRVTAALLKLPYVRSVAQRAGRAELSGDTLGTHQSEFEVSLNARTGAEVAAAQAAIRKTISHFPGASFSANSFLTERIDEVLSGYRAEVVVSLFGSNLNDLDQGAQRVASTLGNIPGDSEVLIQSPPGMPLTVVRLRKNELARWGFDPVQVLDAVRTAFGGDIVGQTYQGNRVFDVSAILAPNDRQSVSEIGALPVRSPAGNYVTLNQLADVYQTSGRYVILHEGARRVQVITCNVTGRSVSAFVQEAQKRISQLSLPSGEYVEFGGTAVAQKQSRNELLLYSLLAAAGIVMLLSMIMRNYRNLLLVLANLPFALVGGIVAAWITRASLSLGALVGFVTLFGITLRNSMLLLDHYQRLVEVEGMEWGLEAALRGASERLSPILMTALVTGLGLLPLALGSGDPGREIEGPMAIVILGGLITSTVLNLLVLPTLSLRYGKFEKSDGPVV
jgi:CzcA family heavy metal efflux pump